jgi:hypothetical protein
MFHVVMVMVHPTQLFHVCRQDHGALPHAKEVSMCVFFKIPINDGKTIYGDNMFIHVSKIFLNSK